MDKLDNQNKLENISTSEIKQVLTILESMIAGKRFGELDSKKQMYLLNCQARIEEMKQGCFDLADIKFLKQSIDSLIAVLCKAKLQLKDYGG